MDTSLVCIDVYTVNEGDTLQLDRRKIRSARQSADARKRYRQSVQFADRPAPVHSRTEDQLPAPAQQQSRGRTHRVAAGDTLYLFAKNYRIKLDDLMRANPQIDPYNLLIGTELNIPS